MSRDVRVVARAKLTLSLRVLGVRDDGFHELEALVVSLRDPHDVVGLRIQAPFGVRIRLSGRAVVGVPVDETNLAVRAARLLLEAAAEGEDPGPWAASGLDVSLHKAIPAGAGLGGGSADAAGALVGGARLLGLGLDTSALVAMASRLGSDVPFCVAGGAAWMRGRGEIIEPLPGLAAALTRRRPAGAGPAGEPPPDSPGGGPAAGAGPGGRLPPPVPSGGRPPPIPPGPSPVPPPVIPPGLPAPPAGPAIVPGAIPPGGPGWSGGAPAFSPFGEWDDTGLALVVVVPPFGLSTPAVYKAWDELGGPAGRAVPIPAALADAGLDTLGLPDGLVNDLEPAAEHVEPRLRPFRDALEAMAGAPALLAGSGSAYVVPATSAAHAGAVAARATAELRATAFPTGLAAKGVEAQRSPD